MKTLNLLGVSQLSPFSNHWEKNEKDGCIEFLFKSTQPADNLSNASFWLLWQGLAFNFKDPTNARLPFSSGPPISGRFVAPYVFIEDKNPHLLIKSLSDILGKHFKRRAVVISDYLPALFSIRVRSKPENKKERKVTLARLSTWLEASPNPIVSFSHCLVCGERIDAGKMFCVSPKYKEHKYNCLNVLNSRIEARLGIKGKDARAKERKRLHKSLELILKKYPLTGWDRFVKDNPKLYTPRYKARWERKRRTGK